MFHFDARILEQLKPPQMDPNTFEKKYIYFAIVPPKHKRKRSVLKRV